MHTVVRNYSSPGATQLFDLLEERKAEVERLIRGAAGFVSYTLVRTDEGGISVTTCQDKSGTDQSLQIARDWIKENASHLNPNPPAVSEGSTILNLN